MEKKNRTGNEIAPSRAAVGERFPSSFMFRLMPSEMEELVANCDRFRTMKHASTPMTAFTEHGILMLASVLHSAIAIQTSVKITLTFVAMRRALQQNGGLLCAHCDEVDVKSSNMI